MDLSRLKKLLANEPKFRFKQAYKAIFQDLIEDWSEATNLSLTLREELNKNCPLDIKAEVFLANDPLRRNASEASKTEKALIILKDGLKIETVLIRHRDGRNTVCVSSQVGCPLGCLFCATGRIGFRRNLSEEEIVEQVLFFARLLRHGRSANSGHKSVNYFASSLVNKFNKHGGQARRLKKQGQPARIATQSVAGGKITNIVFMGMGEPFLNYDNVLTAIKTLNEPDNFNLGARHFSISTAGITHGIKKLAAERLQINLALSLHAPENNLRSRIMPINRKYPLAKVLKAVGEYINKTRRRVMFEYVMIDGLNDSAEQARALAALLKGYLGFVNLISYNQTEMFKPSPADRVKKFKAILEKSGLAVVERHRFGEDIEAACGQLAGRRR